MLKAQAGGERQLSPEEAKEEEAYAAFTKADAERNRLWEEIKRTIESAANREEGEKEVLEKLMPQLEEAMDAYDKAFEFWKEAMQESNEKSRAELAEKE